MLDVQELKGIKLLIVKTTTVLDRDRIRSTPYLDLGVQANDGGVGDKQKFDKTVIRIKIEDINDNPPVFIYSSWRRSIQENSLVLSSVMTISASDNDEGQNAELYYRFESLTDNFYIHPSTGIIGVAYALNASHQSSYELTVIAQDKSALNSKSGKASVSLQIIDIPNYPKVFPAGIIMPRLLKKDFTVTIRADLPVMSFVFLAMVENPEKHIGNPITYTMIGTNSVYFYISPKTGVVTLQQPLDRLINTKIIFKLYISVQNSVKTSDTSVLTVNVQPLHLNLHVPVFSQSTVSIEISESININTEIGYSVSALDDDDGEDGKVTYQIVDGSGIGYFRVNNLTGVLTTDVQFKSIGVYDLYIRAIDSGLYKRFSIMYVRVKILHGFNTPPVISTAMYKCYIPENAEQGSFIGIVYAMSPVPGRTITYLIDETERMRGIAIDRDTGVVTTTQPLDYEQGSSIFLEITIQVQESTQKYKTALLVNLLNENDNPPIFTRSSVTVHVAENSGELSSLVCLFATDEDGIHDFPLIYKIVKGNVDNSFTINPMTGQLSVKNLDYETHKSYDLVVEANDGKSTAKAMVNVIVADTDDPPHFDRYEYKTVLDEGSKENSIIKSIGVTSDTSGSHICSWDYEDVTTEILSLFMLVTEPEACVVKVRGGAKIVWKKDKSEYKISIRALNKNKRNQYSTTRLIVKIQDKNTNPPQFKQDSYALSVVGEQHLGKSIIEVSAIDLDDGETHGRITYDIQDGTDSSLFSIQPSGDIFVKSVLRTMREYVLTVNARKQSSVLLHSSTTVRISIHSGNTELPTFANVEPNPVLETMPIGTIIFTVDAGSSNTGYKIVGGNTDDVFQINKHGQVYLKLELDYESVKEYAIVIRATTPSVPPRYVEKVFNIHVIDVNDNAPIFVVEDPSGEMELFVDRYSPKETIVGKFKAYDKDSGENGIVSYTITGNVPFSVGQEGTITTTRNIDDPIGTLYQFNIVAMDNSKSTSKKSSLIAKALIKSGSIPPLFTQQLYHASLSDNVPIGTPVTTISTTDINPRSTATFKVSGGDLSDYFCIDATKIVSLQRTLDYDTTNLRGDLRISIEMNHDHQSTLTSVSISMEDLNDNWPMFVGDNSVVIEVKEDTRVGYVFYTSSATDADYRQNGRVTYSIIQGIENNLNIFKIDHTTGDLSIGEPLNYEVAEEYVILIKAEDHGAQIKRYALQKVTVKIVDVNDKLPHFTESSYVGYIPTNANPGYHILKVYAVDFDSGRFGQVTYSIFGSDYDGTFNIGRTSGVITLLKPIALLDMKDFRLKLVARDITNEGHVAVHLIPITMEGPPLFALRKFTFNVTENNDPSNSLGRVRGISLDSLTYSIVRGKNKNLFSIDSINGVIYSLVELDAEESVSYLIYIRATDLSERFVETSVEINVLNVNDNSPTFKAANGLIEVIVPRSIPVGTMVVNVEAFDLDVGDRLKYEITSALARSHFTIDNNGIIHILKSIGTLLIGVNQVKFDVIVRDLEGATGTVKVQLTLVQLISGATIIREISELRTPSDSWFITNLPREYSSATYTIVFPSKHPFIIDQSSGYIGLKDAVDYEVIQQYIIIVEEVNTNKFGQYINYEIRIQLIDYNDNKPYFTMENLFGKVNKNAQPGTSVFKLTATDLDSGNAGRIVFEIKTLEVPFDIDPITSEIKTTSLVTLTQEWYNITVQAYDRGIPPQISDLIKIYIKTGDNPPEFSHQVYDFKVSENSQAGKIIGVVFARSLSGINIRYSIESVVQDNLFIIKSDGSIILQGDLDYESGKNMYKLTVQATEMSTQPLMSIVSVIIEVTNVNDNPPVFKEQEYRSQSISENIPIGTTVLTVSATDCDCSQTCHCAGGDLTYVLQKYKDTFRIDDITGEIKTIKKLDYDETNEYRFQVNVYDTDILPQTGVADVVITLLNVNDNAPKFTPDSGTYSIMEIIARGTILLTVQAQDIDGDPITYAIDKGDKGNFEIGTKTGVVQITTQANPTFMQDKYILKISASDGINKGYYTLTVLIEDVNDNNPVFTECSSYRPSVAEQAPVGTVVIKVIALDTDRGRNGEVEYKIMQRAQASSISDFKINNATGVIKTNRVFDREVKRSYILLVIALDGGHSRSPAERNSASCQLEIEIQDINDHAPIFSVQKYDISIAGTTPIDTVVLEVSAHDEDQGKNAELMYSIKQENLTPQFAIDKQTGSISVAMKLHPDSDEDLGFKRSILYSFHVIAVDEGFPVQSSTIEIDINVMPSNPPEFTNTVYKQWITEDVTPGTLILTVNAVSQNAGTEQNIFYSILPGNLPSTNKPSSFNIDSETGEIRSGVKLDYETLREYVLTINAVDDLEMKSNAKVFIYIEDRNDNSPNFMLSKYEFGKIAEGKAPGQIVEIVNATDDDSKLNAEIKYILQPSKESDMFTINPDSGEIRTRVVFDREITPKVTFHVKAEDQAVPPELRLSSYVYVTIQVTDINDNPPGFSSNIYNKTVQENAAIGSNVLEIQAIDKDIGENSRLNYYIISGNEKGYFSTSSIHRASGGSIGYITVVRKLDREDVSMFVLKVAASDSKYNAFALVYISVIDSNDNDPKFTKSLYNASIPENIESGVFVLKVYATDLDTDAVQGPITFSIASGVDGCFTIEESVGDIRTGNKPFDRETKSVYTFLVFASDGTRTGSANVRVIISDVNDETPKFLDGPYVRQVQENQKAGEVVGYVTAKDKDEGQNRLIVYSLLIDAGRFRIHPNTGLIRTKVVLDRESNDNKFVIVVAATDGGKIPLQGTVKVTILVTDANDMHPYFVNDRIIANINECTYIGDVVTKVEAIDNDLDINANVMFAITSGNTPRRFRIDPDTGSITVAHRLDYEKEKIYNLEISVRDKGVPQLISKKNATVIVNMEDCNDNAPACEQSNYIVNIMENATIGHIIKEITVHDSDTGDNGRFVFFIEKASENYQFKIKSSNTNPNVAVIVLDWMLDREKQTEHYIEIGIKDRGMPQKTGTCKLVIKVLDVNDNAPMFEPPVTCGMVMEGEGADSQTAMTVSVVDPDDARNQCPCTFEIINGPSDYFQIQALPAGDKAIIRSKRGIIFDREESGKQIYILKIAVSDGGTPTLTSETTVYIEVDDKDDNVPVSNGILDIVLNTYEGRFTGGEIAPVNILDYDRKIGNIYAHSITSSKSNALSINQMGMVIAERDIQKGKYNMKLDSKDKRRGIVVTSDVKANVRSLSKESISCAVPIRFSGMRKPLTCNELNYPDFESIFRQIFQFDSNYTIEVFSIKEINSLTQTIDVWFYISRKQIMNGREVYTCMPMYNVIVLVYKNWEEIQKQIGKIISVGIDACAKESCPINRCYCYNEIRPLEGYSVFSNENGMVPPPQIVRAFVSLDLEVVPQCETTPIPKFDMNVCDKMTNKNPCLNGGICVPVKPDGFRCNCPPEFDGPQCQRRCRSVMQDGYFWLPKISAFCEGSITFEFSTKRPNGLLLYHGPITSFDAENIMDFLAIDLIDGQIRIRITQGESKVFVKTLKKGKRLDDGIFHHVEMYKKETFIRVTVDYCNEGRSYYDRSESGTVTRTINEACEISGTIPGTKRFINGIYPLQVGMVNDSHLSYSFESFEGNIRSIMDNDYLYDLQNPIQVYQSTPGCADPQICVATPSGVCSKGGTCNGKAGMTCQGCNCPFGFMGDACSEKIPTFSLQENSYFSFSFVKPLTWYDRYTSRIKIQVKTMQDGILLYEGSNAKSGESAEFIILQIVKNTLQYSHNLGDGILRLAIKDLNVANGNWYNISLERTGAEVAIEVMEKGSVVGYVKGRKGQKTLLDTNGIIFVGASVKQIGTDQIKKSAKTEQKFEGCMRISHLYCVYLFKGKVNDKYVTVNNKNVKENCTCGPAPVMTCPEKSKLTCIDGKWVCGAAPTVDKSVGGKAKKLNQMGGVIFIILLLVFFLFIIVGSIIKKRVVKPVIQDQIYYDGDGKDNIMPYQDEGAGEDDYFNYDMEKLLEHVGTLDKPMTSGVLDKPMTPEDELDQPIIPGGVINDGFTYVDGRSQQIAAVQESESKSFSDMIHDRGYGVNVLYDKDKPSRYDASAMKSEETKSASSAFQTVGRLESGAEAELRFQRSQVETIDVALFIETRLADADNEWTSLTKDTLLHYGYEGEGSDVEDLSELDESDEGNEDVDDFSYIRDHGSHFQELHTMLNPPADVSGEEFVEEFVTNLDS